MVFEISLILAGRCAHSQNRPSETPQFFHLFGNPFFKKLKNTRCFTRVHFPTLEKPKENQCFVAPSLEKPKENQCLLPPTFEKPKENQCLTLQPSETLQFFQLFENRVSKKLKKLMCFTRLQFEKPKELKVFGCNPLKNLRKINVLWL